MSFTVSSGKVDITPSLSSNPYMAGYGVTSPRQAVGTWSPLYVRCVVIRDSGTPYILVAADILGFPRAIHQSIRQQIVGLGIPSSHLVLSATHTHNGPVLPNSPDASVTYGLTDLSLPNSYASQLQNTIVNLVQTTLNGVQANCTLDYSVATWGVAFNREGLGNVENTVPVLVARSQSGLPEAIVFGYACHPVAAGLQNLWDGDYAAGACSVVEAAIPGCFALFMQGAAGDQDPASSGRGWNLRDEYAAQLGDLVVNAAANTGRAISSPITATYTEVSLPLDITNTPSNLAAVSADYSVRQDDTSKPVWYQRHASLMLAEISSNSFAVNVALPVQSWRFNGSPQLKIAFVGGEVVSGYDIWARNSFAGGSVNGLWFCGYSNEIPSYIPSNELLPAFSSTPSYGGGWDSDFPGIAGGSQTIYAWLGHYLAGTGGIETVLENALSSQLS